MVIKMKKYRNRILDKVLSEELEAFGGVLITGSKWCGKTTTASQLAKSKVFMHNPENQENLLELAEVNIMQLLKGENPRLIDEWQLAPQLWDAIRFDIDQRSEEGLFILTGSSIVDESKIMHSGIGRISRLYMRTMSLYESKHSNGEVSLEDLFNENSFDGTSCDLELENYIELILRGGWPNSIDKSLRIAMRQVSGYVDLVCENDISEVDGVKRNPTRSLNILKSLSRHVGTQAADTTVLKDISSKDVTMDIDTLRNYIDALKKLYIVEDLSAWSPKLRSKTIIRLKDTRHFVDPAIAASLLNATENSLVSDMKTLGFLFESLVIRDLRIYTDYLQGKVFHYRDSNGLEVDAIVQLNNGKWAAIEVKLGSKRIDTAAKNLVKFSNLFETNKPTFLAIITTTKYGYRREDGVYIIPLGCLKP